jgi:hypothetical protein
VRRKERFKSAPRRMPVKWEIGKKMPASFVVDGGPSFF